MTRKTFILLLVTGLLWNACNKDTDEIPGSGTFTDNRNDKVYEWIRIGDQVWMAENLAYLPVVSPPTEGSTTEPHYYVYGYNGSNVEEARATENYTTYGVLYNWPAAIDDESASNENPSGVQGVCPSNWHLPSETEWIELLDYLGGDTIAGGKLKEAGYDHWNGPNTAADNSSGFTALPGGYRYEGGEFGALKSFGSWWTTTENFEMIKRLSLDDDQKKAGISSYFKDGGFSVRCIKDEW